MLLTIIYNLIVFLLYKKVPVSLSETSYIFGDKKYFFTLYCAALVTTLLPQLLNCVPEDLTFIPFILCVGVLFAGASPAFKNGLDKKVHYISAFISFGAFILFMIFLLNVWYFIGYIVALGLLILWKKECYVYFSELLAIFQVWIYIILNNFKVIV